MSANILTIILLSPAYLILLVALMIVVIGCLGILRIMIIAVFEVDLLELYKQKKKTKLKQLSGIIPETDSELVENCKVIIGGKHETKNIQ